MRKICAEAIRAATTALIEQYPNVKNDPLYTIILFMDHFPQLTKEYLKLQKGIIIV